MGTGVAPSVMLLDIFKKYTIMVKAEKNGQFLYKK